jgi:iron complex outermembrane receptor protein
MVAFAQCALLMACTLTSRPTVGFATQDPTTLTASDLPASGPLQIEEVVVTARRIEENLQKTPVAVTVLSDDQLQARAFADLRDIGRFTPNVYFSNFGAESPDTAAIFIRGVGLSDSFATTDQGVGLYIDGVYYSRPQGEIMDLLDLDRIEVLRGPQGTLFGKNTVGGAINVTSKPPDPNGGGWAALTYGNFDRVEFAGSGNIPLRDDLTLRFTGAGKHRNCLYNREWDQACYGDIERLGGRAYFRWTPSSNLTVDLIADSEIGRSHQLPNHVVNYNPAVGVYALWNTLVGARVLPGQPFTLTNPGVNPSNPYFSSGSEPTEDPLDAKGVSLQVHWKLGPTTLHSITAYRSVYSTSNEDVIGDPNVNGAPDPGDVWDLTKSHWASQEFRTDGSILGGRLEYVAGLYGFTETGVTNEAISELTILNVGWVNYNTQVTDSYAGFAHVSYAITDRLKASAGARLNRDTKYWTAKYVPFDTIPQLDPAIATSTIIRMDPAALPNALTGTAAFTNKSASWTPVTPQFGLDYQATDDLLIFGDVARGYRSGGFNGRVSTATAVAPYAPEYTTSYELGLKSDLFNRRIRFNATGFHTDYKDMQQSVLTCVRNSAGGCVVTNGTSQFAPVVANAAAARIIGGEAEITALLGAGWRLETSVGYTDAKFTSVNAAATAATGLSLSSVLPYVPKLTAALGVDDKIDTTFGSVPPRLDYTYRTTTFFTIYGNQSTALQGPVGLLNGTVSWLNREGKWSMTFYGRNLTNKFYYTFANDLSKVGIGSGTLVDIANPREYGLIIRRNFF